MRKGLCAALLVLASSAAQASDRIHVCAKAASGKTYSVDATLITGQELIQRTHSFEYESYSKYVAIFWDQQHVTLINIGGLVAPNAIPLDGIDQEGRHWQISTGPICI